MIVMTATQANKVRGISSPGAMLEPILLADGNTFVLPERVLTDPDHQSKWAVLTTYPTRTVAANEYVQGDA